MHLAALRIDARHHVLDRAVLAGGVHRLEDREHRPAVLRVELLLQLRQPLDAVGEHRLGLGLFDVEAAGVGGIEVGETELVRLVDAEALDHLVRVSWGQLHAARRPLASASVSRHGRIRRHLGRHAADRGRPRPRTIANVGQAPAVLPAQDDRGCARRNASAFSRACIVFIRAIRWPAAHASPSWRRVATSRAARPVSSASSRITLPLEIDRAADNVGRLGRAGREIDPAGIRGVRAPSRRAGRRRRPTAAPPCAKQLQHRLVGKIPSRARR